MNEKVKIKSCIDSGKKWNDKPIINIELEDGRKGSAFDNLFLGLDIGQEYEIDIREGKEYNGQKQYIFNMPGQKKKGFSKDWTYDKRKTSLECAIESLKLSDKKDVTSNQIIELSKKFYSYLNEK